MNNFKNYRFELNKFKTILDKSNFSFFFLLKIVRRHGRKMALEKAKFSAEDDYPDFSEHNNHMSKRLSKEIYAKLWKKVTPNGFTLSNAIQTGVDNPGTPK